MTDLAGLLAYGVTVWAALTLLDELGNRRRIAAWKQRAEHIHALQRRPRP